jgi:alkanesulfonate monooxygenase SsuD/methylene tetrahydromethanopterin reductase-like flavin-dependent oxidoreductase (luciferase family)
MLGSTLAGHFAMRSAVEAIALYRDRYAPSPRHPAPQSILAVTTVCAPTDDEAQRLAAPLRVAIVKTRTGRRAPIASVDEALAYRFTADEQAIADEFFAGAVIGSPATVAVGLRALAARTGADELMVSALLPELATRTRSLRLIAEALG